jgi:hypothetical protein
VIAAAVGYALLASAVVGFGSGWFVHVMPGAMATRVLAVTSLILALGTGFVLTVVTIDVLAQIPEVSAGHWSLARLLGDDPVPPLAGTLAGVTLAVLLASSVRRTWAVARELLGTYRTCRELGGWADGLVIVDDARPRAYAVPGLTSGRVVATTGMLRALDAGERRALLAHEASHLAHHHHLYLALGDLAAAANPLLRPVPTALRWSVERWADEDAGVSVGDRRLVARAVARAGLATITVAKAQARSPLTTELAITGSVVERRAQALLLPTLRPRRVLAGAILALAVVMVGTGGLLAHETEDRFENAKLGLASSAVVR